MEQWWNSADKRKPKYSEKTCPTVTLFTIKITRIGLGLNRVSKVRGQRLLESWHSLPAVSFDYITSTKVTNFTKVY
jgi:hypothetical protein